MSSSKNCYLDLIKPNSNANKNSLKRILEMLESGQCSVREEKIVEVEKNHYCDVSSNFVSSQSKPKFGSSSYKTSSSQQSSRKWMQPELPLQKESIGGKGNDNNRFNSMINFANDSTFKQIQPNQSNSMNKRAFQVIYGKYKPHKKNKEWTFDGFITIDNSIVVLFHENGSKRGRTELGVTDLPKSFVEGTQIVIGGHECQLSNEIDIHEFESGAYFITDE